MGTLALHTGFPESRLGAQDSPGRLLGGPGVRGRPLPTGRDGAEPQPEGHAQRPPASPSVSSLTWLDLDGRSEVVLPERGLG